MGMGATGSGIMVASTAEEVEMGHSDNATPRQQNVQALDSAGEVEFTEPYKTPLVLRKKKPAPAPVNESEAEVSDLELRAKGKKKNKGKGRVGSFLLIDLA